MDDKAINLISVMLKDIEEYKDIDPLDIYLNKSTFNKEERRRNKAWKI